MQPNDELHATNIGPRIKTIFFRAKLVKLAKMKDRVAVLAHLEMKFEAFTAINKDTVII